MIDVNPLLEGEDHATIAVEAEAPNDGTTVGAAAGAAGTDSNTSEVVAADIVLIPIRLIEATRNRRDAPGG